MSLFSTSFARSVVVRESEAETAGKPPVRVQLLADSSATGGALSTVRVTLEKDADGAKPHHHAGSSEMFYVLDGGLDVLSGSDIVSVSKGDLVVVPPHMPHAFSAAKGKSADLLIVIAPGVERFEYFRKLERIAYGKEPPETLKDVQELYDTFFLQSPAWDGRKKA